MTDWFERFTRHLRELFLGPEEEANANNTSPPGGGSFVESVGTTLYAHPPYPGDSGSAAPHATVTPSTAPREPRPRFLLSVDGAGQTLVTSGDRVTIGHLRVGQADLPFLADVGPLHAELVRMESLRDGPVWTIRPLGGETVLVDGTTAPEGGCLLSAGARVQLGENLVFRFLVPDDASSTVLLEILTSSECAGAKTVALFGEGDGGRLRIGAAEKRHIRVPNLEHEISITVREGKLLIRCEAGVSRPEESTTDVFSLPFPPPQRVDLQVGTSRGGRPPFSLAIAPADLPEFAGPGGTR